MIYNQIVNWTVFTILVMFKGMIGKLFLFFCISIFTQVKVLLITNENLEAHVENKLFLKCV